LTAAAAAGTAVLFFYPYFGDQDQPAGERAAAFGVGLRGTF